jgi:3-oxoacyl-[acyl-carrier protein] reductase
VQVNCIHPSLVDTDRQRIAAEIERSGRSETDIRAQLCREAGTTRFGTPQDVADLVCFIVSARGSWLHGATIDLDGGEIPVL